MVTLHVLLGGSKVIYFLKIQHEKKVLNWKYSVPAVYKLSEIAAAARFVTDGYFDGARHVIGSNTTKYLG